MRYIYIVHIQLESDIIQPSHLKRRKYLTYPLISYTHAHPHTHTQACMHTHTNTHTRTHSLTHTHTLICTAITCTNRPHHFQTRIYNARQYKHKHTRGHTDTHTHTHTQLGELSGPGREGAAEAISSACVHKAWFIARLAEPWQECACGV